MDSTMTPETSADSFKKFLLEHGRNPKDLNIAELMVEVLSFYENIRCSGLSSSAQSDMALYQWGTYDWGTGKHFELDVTRQFIADGHDDDDAISQLSITALFKPKDELTALKSESHWCQNVDDIGNFRDYIEKSAPYILLENSKPETVSIEWSPI